jgi:hypothetical protein
MIPQIRLKNNTRTLINFDGGDLSSDSGMLLIKEFLAEVGFLDLIRKLFKIKGDTAERDFTNDMMLYQQIMLMIAGYHNQSDVTSLKDDPVFKECFDSLSFASQSNFSRFFSRLNSDSHDCLEAINQKIVDQLLAYNKPEFLILDLDSTHFQAYGKQEQRNFNYHYQAEGYHPLMLFEESTGLCLKSELRTGSDYTSNGVVDFMEALLIKYENKYKKTCRLVRGDSGFAVPGLFDLCENYSSHYVIRLKSNAYLSRLAKEVASLVCDPNKFQQTQTATGEFMYQAGSWTRERRVIVQATRKAGSLVPDLMYIVTNLEARQHLIIDLYKKRGTMENFIKECKNDFRMDKVSHQKFIANANRMQMAVLAYNLMIVLKKLVLPPAFANKQTRTIRFQLFKVAARRVKGAGYVTFKACSHFIHKDAWIFSFGAIRNLKLKFE